MYNRAVMFLLRAVFLAVHRLSRAPTRQPPPPEDVRDVLLVSTTGLGDTVMSIPAMTAARRSWPRARIVALLHGRWAALLANAPFLDDVIIYPGKFKNLGYVMGRLRGLRPDLALILHANDPDIVPLVYMSGAGYIAGWSRSRFSFLMDAPVDYSDPDEHMVERRLDVVRKAGGGAAHTGVEIFLPEQSRRWAARYWADRGAAPEDKIIALNPGGSLAAKRWPSEYWRELIKDLGRRPAIRTALFGSTAEKDYLTELAGAAGSGGVLVEAGRDLMEAAALLEQCAALVGPDSGLAHTAQGVGTPAVIIFGPDNPALSGPGYGHAPAAVLQAAADVCPDLAVCKVKECSHQSCLKAVTPQQVLDALENRLGLDLSG